MDNKYHRQTIEYWKQNAEEDYLKTPISVLKYITVLELAVDGLSSLVSISDTCTFAEYFHNNFDYYDCNANGRLYKWVESSKRNLPAMSMKQIFDIWKEINVR